MSTPTSSMGSSVIPQTPQIHIHSLPKPAAPFDTNATVPQPLSNMATPTETPASSGTVTFAPPHLQRPESGAMVLPLPKAALQKTKKSGAIRGSGFTTAETDSMLDTVQHFLPLCRDEWDAVLTEHNKLCRDQMRTVDSLKRKFATLNRKKMPTGDPLMPAEVRRAKHIRYKMTERADLGCGDEESNLITGLGSSSGDEIDETHSSEETSPVPIGTEISADDALPTPTPVTSATPVSLPPPRPLIAKRNQSSSQSFRFDDILTMMKMSMIQEQQRRDQDIERREEDKKLREKERREERLRREHESKRQERYFEALLMMMASNRKQDSRKPE